MTGNLHMGHMLNQTEMDILIRWHRMRGDRVLWVPGTDHAGIATQMMVERQLASEGTTRQKLGREAFVERVWEWRRHYGGAILDQMKRLGASVDWDREYFTMDERLSVAVREAFVRLHEQGLIYRGAYIVNWCPRCQTAISDLEVVYDEHKGHLWEIRYPVLGDDGTRDGRVSDCRDHAAGNDAGRRGRGRSIPRTSATSICTARSCGCRFMNREIPIILDEWVSREFGTGAVKVTPAHDPNDFAIGQRHNLPSINVMDETAHINENGGAYAGLDRYVARKKIVARPRRAGAPGRRQGSHQQRGPLRPLQDGGRAAALDAMVHQDPAAGGQGDCGGQADEDGKGIRFTPEMYEKTYLKWMENIHDWCISRQLWWGHRIPAWHCAACHKITVARQDPDDVRALRIGRRSRRRPTCSTRGSPPACCRFRCSAGRISLPRIAPISTRSIPRACSSPASTSSSSGWRA